MVECFQWSGRPGFPCEKPHPKVRFQLRRSGECEVLFNRYYSHLHFILKRAVTVTVPSMGQINQLKNYPCKIIRVIYQLYKLIYLFGKIVNLLRTLNVSVVLRKGHTRAQVVTRFNTSRQKNVGENSI